MTKVGGQGGQLPTQIFQKQDNLLPFAHLEFSFFRYLWSF